MIITTVDPISMEDIVDIENAPYVIEGTGPNAVKIHFENEANKLEYLAIPLLSVNNNMSNRHSMSAEP